MNFGSQCGRRNQGGYILLTLMLFVALLTIGLLAMVQNIESQIKRDREEELIHRGVQYSRAVRHYFKKFGRYPNRIEELENTNNYRSLRKRYKDPITGKDFKPLHMTDVQMSFVGGGAGAGLPTGLGPNVSAAGGLNGAASVPGAPGQGAASQNPQAGDQSGTSEQTNQTNQTDQTGQSAPGTAAAQSSAQSVKPGPAPSTESGPAAGQVFGGGAIVGVASVSKDKTIRVFNKKDHYNQWQFIYDPTSDRGGLLMTPNQPPLKGATSLNPANGTQGTAGQNPGQQGIGGTPVQPNPLPPDH